MMTRLLRSSLAPAGVLALLLGFPRATAVAGQEPAPQQEEWLFVHGSGGGVGTLGWEEIGRSYLRNFDWELVGAAESSARPKASRFIVGRPEDNELVAQLAPQLGIGYANGGVQYRGTRSGPGTGLLVCTRDPDGGGRLALFTGADPDGVLATLSVQVNFLDQGFVVARAGRILQKQILLSTTPLVFPTREVRVQRLDADFDRLLEANPEAAPADRILQLARGLQGYDFVYESAYGAQVDLTDLMASILEEEGLVQRTREAFAGRDLDSEIRELYARTTESLESVEGPRPVFFVLYGHPNATNAATFDHDPLTGRWQILLNLGALTRGNAFAVAVVHETVHTLQTSLGSSLAVRAVSEGVASYLSQALLPEVADHEALMWTPEQLQAARERHAEILASFNKRRNETDRAVFSDLVILGDPLREVPGAPDRCAYYLGWLAARAWVAAHPDAGLRGLLAASAEQVLAALE